MPSDPSSVPPNIRFYYVKSGLFRVLHVDGILGGITPRGLIHFVTYSERPAIPQVAEHALSPEGVLSGTPTTQEGKVGIVREMDVDLVMSKQTAIDLRSWLTDRIAEFEKLEEAGGVELPMTKGSSDA